MSKVIMKQLDNIIVYVDEELYYTRHDGPAVINMRTGNITYQIKNKRHRIDGPSECWASHNLVTYYICDHQFLENEYYQVIAK